MRLPLLLPLLLLLPSLPLRAADDPVRTTETPTAITASNGLVAFTLSKTNGRVTSLKARIKASGQMVELGENSGKTIYMHYVSTPEPLTGATNKTVEHPEPVQKNMIRLVASSADAADILVGTEPTDQIPFHIEWHLLLRRGEPGIYIYLTYRHGPGMAAANFVQAGWVVRGVAGQTLFTHYLPDGPRITPIPTGKVVKEVQDATWLYDDGKLISKYDFCDFAHDAHVYGMAGHGVGLWMVMPSWESCNGGPLKQELTVHQGPLPAGPQTNIVQWIVQGEHFGATGIPIKADEKWSRFYGPMFLYINQAPSIDALWADAQNRAAAEIKKWPYAFIKNADYPLVRGTLTGKIHLADGTSPKDAWVVLTDPDEPDFCLASKGYQFWTQADAAGNFTIDKVRPGTYRLHLSGADQPQDFHKDNILIAPHDNLDLGTLEWTPITHGKRLWQIGTFDRSTREFKGGDDFRHYDNFQRYLRNFPHDVAFTIGHSREAADWNMGQWQWYNEHPYWSVFFDSPAAQTGEATLTIALAAADARQLALTLNGHPLKTLDLQTSGAAVYRSGGQDSRRQLFIIPFDAARIHAGSNELRLQIPGSYPAAGNETKRAVDVRALFYDALRLEVDPTAKPPP